MSTPCYVTACTVHTNRLTQPAPGTCMGSSSCSCRLVVASCRSQASRPSGCLSWTWWSEESALPVPLQLLWLEGRAFPISRQQNQAEYNRFALYAGVVRCSLLLLETAWTAWPLWAPQSRDGRGACCSGGSASSVSPRSCPRPCRCGSYHARVASPCSSRRRRRGARRDLTRGRSRVLADWAVYRESLAHCFVDGSPADRVMTSPSVRSWMVRTLY